MIKVKAFTIKAGERPIIMAVTLNHLIHDKVILTINTQVKVLIDLIKSLLRAIEEQKALWIRQWKTNKKAMLYPYKVGYLKIS